MQLKDIIRVLFGRTTIHEKFVLITHEFNKFVDELDHIHDKAEEEIDALEVKITQAAQEQTAALELRKKINKVKSNIKQLLGDDE